MYIGITIGLIGFLAIATVIAITISEEDFVAIITVMYNGKKEFHLSIGADESIVPFVNDKTDKVIVELEE